MSYVPNPKLFAASVTHFLHACANYEASAIRENLLSSASSYPTPSSSKSESPSPIPSSPFPNNHDHYEPSQAPTYQFCMIPVKLKAVMKSNNGDPPPRNMSSRCFASIPVCKKKTMCCLGKPSAQQSAAHLSKGSP